MEGPLDGNKGKAAGSLNDAIFEDCEAACLANEECKSLTYHSGNKKCSFKQLELTGTEPIVTKNPNFFTAYKECKIGKHTLNIYLDESCDFILIIW